jgi:hypothetical protein
MHGGILKRRNTMKDPTDGSRILVDRRSFMKNGLTTAGTAAMGAALLSSDSLLFAAEGQEEKSGSLTKGDAALLRFAAAAEILESDFWIQYNELGGIQDNEVSGGSGNPAYTAALSVLDADSHNTFTIIPTMKSHMRSFSMRTLCRKVQSQWISGSFGPCPAALLLDRAENHGLPI